MLSRRSVTTVSATVAIPRFAAGGCIGASLTKSSGACNTMTEEEESVPASNGVERLEAVAGSHVRHATDDTIELPLTEEDMLALSRAAEKEHTETSLHESALITAGAFVRDLIVRSRTRRWPLVLAFSVFGIAIGVVLGVVVADRISTETISEPPSATNSAESLYPPVRFGNPFDASEVFEFPPGTSVDQARESVAAMLLQRARDRQRMGLVKSNQRTPGPAADRARIARNSETRAVSSWR